MKTVYSVSSQNCPFAWGSGPPSYTGFPGPNRVHNPNDILIISAIFAGLTTATDRPRYTICNNRPHLHSTAMWPNNTCLEKEILSIIITSYILLIFWRKWKFFVLLQVCSWNYGHQLSLLVHDRQLTYGYHTLIPLLMWKRRMLSFPYFWKHPISHT